MESDTRGGVNRGVAGKREALFLRLGVVVLGANVVTLNEEFVTLFLQCLRHFVAKNEWLATSRREQRGKKYSVGVADQSVPQVGRDPPCRSPRGRCIKV